MIENTIRLLNECTIDFSQPANKNKSLFTDSVAEDRELLLKECEKGMRYRYGYPDNKIKQRSNIIFNNTILFENR